MDSFGAEITVSTFHCKGLGPDWDRLATRQTARCATGKAYVLTSKGKEFVSGATVTFFLEPIFTQDLGW